VCNPEVEISFRARGASAISVAVNCPFCLEDVKPGALVCRTCARDIAVPKPLMEANERLTARVAELEAELARPG